jgi:hypothetical protein
MGGETEMSGELKLLRSDVFEVFKSWQAKGTQLRVDAQIQQSNLSVEGTVQRVEEPIVSVDLAYRGYVEFTFEDAWHFGYPDSTTAPLDDRSGGASRKSRQYEFGEMILAVNIDRHYILFMEILRALD